MKQRYFFTISFVLLLFRVFSETITIPVDINWQGINRIITDSIYREVITFEGAQHSMESPLPNYHHSISIDNEYDYRAELQDVIYIPLIPEEENLIQDSHIISNELESFISTTRGKNTYHIIIHPFKKEEGIIKKLLSFNLEITKQPRLKKSIYSNTIHNYSEQSVLSQGRFIKLRITESGIYKIPYSELRNRGLNPENIRMFGYGGAVLAEDFTQLRPDDLPETAIYDTGNAILFYAQGINKWTYDSGIDMFTHTLNPYSGYGYYFITSDNIGEKKRIEFSETVNSGSSPIQDITEFTDYKVHEKELINIINAGREFYGEKLLPGNSIEIPFNFKNLMFSENIKANLNVIGISTKTKNSSGVVTTNNISTFSLSLNNGITQTLNVDGREINNYEAAVSASKIYNFTSVSEDLVFKLAFDNSNETTASGYLNYLEVNAQCSLKMESNIMLFHNKMNISANSFNRYILETDNYNIHIWDVNDILNIKRIPTSIENGKVTYIDSSSEAKTYVAINPSDLSDIPEAELLYEVPQQNIHGMGAIDMLIITHPLFLKPAENLAQAHNNIRGLKVGVVTTEQVYNEFSSGTPNVTAYRWVCKMFYDKPQNEKDKIKYLLLVGKGSYDNRGLLPEMGENFILTYQAVNSLSQTKSYVTDDYFGLLDDGEGLSIGYKDKIDIGIGRFPVSTEEEAEKIVQKTIRYMKNENKGTWKNQLCFLGDNGDDNSHMKQADSFADRVGASYPSYHINKILLDAYQKDAVSSSYPDAKRYFQDLINSGLFFINYMGHGTINGWGNTLTNSEIKAFQNENLPLFTSGTCEFSRFDRGMFSAGEEILRNSLGGGIGVFSAARTVYSNYNETLMRHFCDSLFILPYRGENNAVGDAVMKAKNASFSSSDLGANTLSFIYFGDPSVKLNYPTQYNVSATEINGNNINGKDTLQALSVVTLKGIISDSQGVKAENFKGSVYITVLDKVQTITTLDNLSKGTPYVYTNRDNIIFKGKAGVVNGEFEITFMLPKDIKYNYGGGRFNFYAWDEQNGYEAQGYCEDFIIGGMNNEFVDETDGPDVEIYLNDKSFVSGQKVGQNPVFMADLYDMNGINTSSVTPGHDIMLCIDNESWYELNDYYEIKNGNYKEGNIIYPLPEMEEGKHILMFRAWDLLNNSTLKTLEFEIVKDMDNSFFSVNFYPNPVVTAANIKITHDNTDINLVKIEIFDLSGRKIWSYRQNSLENISWNLTNDNGNKITSGIYIYTVTIQNNEKIISTKSDKIIVIKQ